MLELQNISAAYRKDYLILDQVSINIEQGKKTAILGRNGVGKSTLAKSIMGLVPYRTGEILLKGISINGLRVHQLIRHGMGYFHQGGQVFPQMSVEENLRFARFKNPGAQGLDMTLMKDHFSILNDPRIYRMKAGDLSGGERTQLALAMVLINKPELLILDEPFAGVSPTNTESIIQFMQKIDSDWPFTLLLIEQNQYLAQRLCDDVFVLKQKQLFPFLSK